MSVVNPTDAIKLGYISGCFGVKGWLKVFSHCSPRENIFNHPNWQLNQTTIEITNKQISSKKLAVKLKGIDSRNDAEALVGQIITVQKLPELPENEYYWQDLIGLEVVNQQHQNLGIVQELLTTAANDILVINGDYGRILIPYTLGTHILSVDLSKNHLLVNWQIHL